MLTTILISASAGTIASYFITKFILEKKHNQLMLEKDIVTQILRNYITQLEAMLTARKDEVVPNTSTTESTAVPTKKSKKKWDKKPKTNS